jgi:hypothetical protein
VVVVQQSPSAVTLGDVAAFSTMLHRLLHHVYVLKCGPMSWRTKIVRTPQVADDLAGYFG